jgi:hypothetical protein
MTIQPNEASISGLAVNGPTNADLALWNDLKRQSSEFEGYTVIGGKDNELSLSLLEGVPFILKAATFREGDITPAGHDRPRDYVSCEIMIDPAERYKFPRGYLVLNDGSTGIYRQVVKALAERGKIDLPGTLPEDGDANTTKYDLKFTEDGVPLVFAAVNIFCPTGLEPSDYKNTDGSDARTWYIA